jgi:hypothetical protein
MKACGASISALKKQKQRKKEKFGQHRGVQRDHLCPERERGEGEGGGGGEGGEGGGGKRGKARLYASRTFILGGRGGSIGL